MKYTKESPIESGYYWVKYTISYIGIELELEEVVQITIKETGINEIWFFTCECEDFLSVFIKMNQDAQWCKIEKPED